MTLAELQAVPYLDGGRTLRGADCYGWGRLYNAIMLGRELPLHSGITADSGQFPREVIKARDTWARIDRKDIEAGDGVLLERLTSADPLHIAWSLGGDGIAHTTALTGVIYTDFADDAIAYRMRGIFRYEPAG